MRAAEFLTENPVDEISQDLRHIGLHDLRIDSGKTISVYVPPAERLSIMQQLEDNLPGALWDKTYSNSSVGAIRYKNGVIRVRPKGKAGGDSAGLGNESQLISQVTNAIAQAGEPIDIVFQGSNGVTWTVHDCTKIEGVGKDTSGRKKADVVFTTGGIQQRASIKKDNAEYWESADTYFGHEADEIIDKLVDEGKIELMALNKTNSAGNPFIKLSREIAVKATPQEVEDVIFGSDLKDTNGAVLKQTFSPNHFKLIGNQLTVKCSTVIVQTKDVPREAYVYFLIRNDSSRGRPNYKYPGIRSTAIYRKRISSKTLKVDRR
jgi:hypothetical protein